MSRTRARARVVVDAGERAVNAELRVFTRSAGWQNAHENRKTLLPFVCVCVFGCVSAQRLTRVTPPRASTTNAPVRLLPSPMCVLADISLEEHQPVHDEKHGGNRSHLAAAQHRAIITARARRRHRAITIFFHALTHTHTHTVL